MPGPIERGIERKKQLEKKQNQSGFFNKIRSIFSGENDPSRRGAERTSPEALKKEEEARKKRIIK